MTIIAKSAISIALAASCANATATTENLFHPDEAVSYCAPRSHALVKLLKKLGDAESYLFTNKFITGGLSIPKGCTGELDYPEMADRSNPNERILVAISCPNSTPARFHDFFFSTASFSEKQCLLRETNSEPPITICGRSYVANTPIFFAFGKLDCRRTILDNTVGGKTNPYEGK